MTPDKNTHNNTHKNMAINAFINRFVLICLIASASVLTACGDKESAESRYGWSSRSFTLEDDLSGQVANASTRKQELDATLAYLRRIGFEDYQREGTIGFHAIRGDDFDAANTSLGATDGILVMQTSGNDGGGGHVFAGRLGTTDVGPAFAQTEPTATFRGRAVILMVHNRGGGFFNSGNSLENVVSFDNLALTANFEAGTLSGSNTNSLGERLDVNARINDNILNGTVDVTFTNSAITSAANRSLFAANNLTGRIGENGAVATFASHLARGRPSDYALGGGFVVKPNP